MGTTPAATASHAPTLSAAASVSSAFNCLVRLRLVAVGEPVTGAPSRRRLGRGGPLRWPQPAAAAWRCRSTGRLAPAPSTPSIFRRRLDRCSGLRPSPGPVPRSRKRIRAARVCPAWALLRGRAACPARPCNAATAAPRRRPRHHGRAAPVTTATGRPRDPRKRFPRKRLFGVYADPRKRLFTRFY